MTSRSASIANANTTKTAAATANPTNEPRMQADERRREFPAKEERGAGIDQLIDNSNNNNNKPSMTQAQTTAANFMSKFRDKDTRVLKNLNSQQFIEVWNNYDKDGKFSF